MQHWLSTLAIVIVACSAIRHYESCTSLVHIVAKPLPALVPSPEVASTPFHRNSLSLAPY